MTGSSRQMRLQHGFNLAAALSALVAASTATACSGGDDSTGGDGAGGASSSSSTPGSSSSSSAGGGGAGGMETAPTFVLSIVPINVDLPYGGQATIDLKINRFYGFDEPIDVVVSRPPPGLAAMPLTVPADASTAALVVGASGALTIGSRFDLKLFATSGNQLSVAAVPVSVVEPR
jgi:hypothetical protein